MGKTSYLCRVIIRKAEWIKTMHMWLSWKLNTNPSELQPLKQVMTIWQACWLVMEYGGQPISMYEPQIGLAPPVWSCVQTFASARRFSLCPCWMLTLWRLPGKVYRYMAVMALPSLDQSLPPWPGEGKSKEHGS